MNKLFWRVTLSLAPSSYICLRNFVSSSVASSDLLKRLEWNIYRCSVIRISLFRKYSKI
uniref:Transferase, transferring glycosyl groups n=1 Tax=Arundo donax TaxID=35708 RepID=A0A0A9EQM0_ARUDO